MDNAMFRAICIKVADEKDPKKIRTPQREVAALVAIRRGSSLDQQRCEASLQIDELNLDSCAFVGSVSV
jgi:hypothetical protein